ncbi:hypothetical protein [Nocardia sp. CC227C]|uniref:hypothetical protein n=1 Tax=Nocardia sp. CC227C TaxID=3044562 RepID=UPI00278C1A1D|nr:hypothetical protein [Nocardia sp. CC227C]
MTVDLNKRTDSRRRRESTGARPAPRSVAIPLTTLRWAAAVAVVTVVAVALGVLLLLARNDIAERDAVAADDVRAEQVATDYAVGASTVNFADFNAWVVRLKNNTAPALANKFDASAPALQEIITPLRWTSTAMPITAKVVSESGGVYKVNVFVNVSSTNAQNPDGAQTTVTYNVTVDRNADWKVTDVGGMEGALPLK